MSYGLGGPMIAIAAFSLALNLMLTGLFITIVKRLLTSAEADRARDAAQRTAHPRTAGTPSLG